MSPKKPETADRCSRCQREVVSDGLGDVVHADDLRYACSPQMGSPVARVA